MAIATIQQTETPLDLIYFELLPGKMLDIQINHPVRFRIKLPLIGYEEGKNIIIKYPKISNLGSYKDVLVDGNCVIVRYLLEGECFAFSSSIHSIIQYPNKYLVLNYPTKIEHRQLRLHQRVTTHIPASIVLNAIEPQNSDEEISGIIEDISLKGCGFSFQTDNQKLKVNKKEIIVIVKSFMDGEIKIPAKVCNSRNEHGKISIGIQFSDDCKQIKHLLKYLFID